MPSRVERRAGDPPESHPVIGLRERKKAKTRAAIRDHALRLFGEQGYANTTVEQIAEAAEVSPSTFFRYFPTKEDVVLADDFDPLLVAAFLAQPTELSPIRALRNAVRSVFEGLDPEGLEQEQLRSALIASVPELRARMLEELARTVQTMAEALATRLGRRADDFEVRNFVGAVMGVSLAAMLPTLDGSSGGWSDERYWDLLDAGLAHLEDGLPL